MQDNKDNNNVNDIDNKNADNSTDTSTTEKKDEYEKVCYVCHRTESRAGKMINMGIIYTYALTVCSVHLMLFITVVLIMMI